MNARKEEDDSPRVFGGQPSDLYSLGGKWFSMAASAATFDTTIGAAVDDVSVHQRRLTRLLPLLSTWGNGFLFLVVVLFAGCCFNNGHRRERSPAANAEKIEFSLKNK